GRDHGSVPGEAATRSAESAAIHGDVLHHRRGEVNRRDIKVAARVHIQRAVAEGLIAGGQQWYVAAVGEGQAAVARETEAGDGGGAAEAQSFGVVPAYQHVVAEGSDRALGLRVGLRRADVAGRIVGAHVRRLPRARDPTIVALLGSDGRTRCAAAPIFDI